MMPYVNGSDQTVVMYMEQADVTAGRTRASVSTGPIAKGSSPTIYNTTITTRRGLGALLYLKAIGEPGTAFGSITISISFVPASGMARYTYTKRMPYRDVAYISVVDMADKLKAEGHGLQAYAVYVSVKNETDHEILPRMVTIAPIAAFSLYDGLESFGVGVNVGEDEDYLDFGVSNGYGSVRIRDNGQRILDILKNGSDYGLPDNLFRTAMRCEVYVGESCVSISEVKSLNYSENDRKVDIELASPLLRLRDYSVRLPRIVSPNITIAGYASAVFSALGNAGVNLSAFDLTPITTGPYFAGFSITPYITEEISPYELLEYIAQATAINFMVNPYCAKASMKYSLYYFKWFDGMAPSITIGGWSGNALDLGPSALLGSPQYNPFKGNYVDKITYDKTIVSKELTGFDEERTYPITRMRPFKATDKSDFVSEWLGKSGVSSVPSTELRLGHRYPTRSDLTYANGKWAANITYDQMDKRLRKAMARMFLWRFSFPDTSDYSAIAAPATSGLKGRGRVVESNALYSNASPSYQSLFVATGARLSGSTKFTYHHGQSGSQVGATANGRYPVRGFNLNTVFQNLNSGVSLYVPIDDDVVLYEGDPVTAKVSITYWYTQRIGASHFGWANGEVAWGNAEATMKNTQGWDSPDLHKELYWNVSHYKWEWGIGTQSGEVTKYAKMSEYFKVEWLCNQSVVNAYDAGRQTIGDGEQTLYERANSAVFGVFYYWDAAFDGAFSKVGLHSLFDTGEEITTRGIGAGQTGYDGFGMNNGLDDVPWGPMFSNIWYHTGTDADAKGAPQTIRTATLTVSLNGSNVVVGEDGRTYVKVALPTDSEAKAAIRAGDDNFIGTSDNSLVNDSSPYCFFFNTYALWSVLGIGDSAVYDSNGDALVWFNGIMPFYGYVAKDAIVSISGQSRTANTESVVVQYNKSNKFNVTLQTNGLINDLAMRNGSQPLYDWLIEGMVGQFSNGRYRVGLKSRASVTQRASADGVFGSRPPYPGDPIQASRVSIMRQGGEGRLLPDVSGYFVKSVEYVYENGEAYYNLTLWEK